MNRRILSAILALLLCCSLAVSVSAEERNISFVYDQLEYLTQEERDKMMAEMPSDGFRMALTVMVAMPLVIAYPFFQKYFAKGLTVGAVKG